MTVLIAPSGKAIVKLDESASYHSNGLAIPDTAKKVSAEATVVSSGYSEVEAGDRVLLKSENGYLPGATFKVGGEEYTTVEGAEILAILEG